MKQLQEYGNGEHLEHDNQCWKLDDKTIVNKKLDFLTSKEDVYKYCEDCDRNHLCLTLLGIAEVRESRNTYKAKKGRRK